MEPARFLIIGGFLGAGKTTSLLLLARSFQNEGKRVGLITNDQAPSLVDTGSLRAQGLRVEEVAGACFCCKFDELAQAAERLRQEAKPDILLGEPVGSCTDLAATVVLPLRRLYGDRYRVAPYSVLVDPTRARQLLLEKGFGGFSAKVAYIFQKQLEEADVICLNKTDLLTPAERTRLLGALEREFPKAQVLGVSALSGEGFDAWRARLDAGSAAGSNATGVDYDVYAEGEAELGWLNLAARVDAEASFDPDALVCDLVEGLRHLVASRRSEIAHLKAMIESEGGAAIANCVGGASPVRLSQPLASAVRSGRLTLNARVHMDPDLLKELAGEALARAAARQSVSQEVGDSSHFRPGRPVPTHRDGAPRS